MVEVAARLSVGLVETAWLAPQPPLSRLVLRGDSAVRAAASQAFGVELSGQACRAAQRGLRAALWLGPDERPLLAPAEEGEALHAGLVSALAGHAYSLVSRIRRAWPAC